MRIKVYVNMLFFSFLSARSYVGESMTDCVEAIVPTLCFWAIVSVCKHVLSY